MIDPPKCISLNNAIILDFPLLYLPFFGRSIEKLENFSIFLKKTLGFSPLPLGELILLGPDNLVLSLHVDGPPALLADHGDDLL